ncbi:hypothetical protein VC87395_003438, partial [Vibrio paracholerae 87395]
MEGVIKVDGTIPDELEETWKKILEELRVCCFTPDDSNTLMCSGQLNLATALESAQNRRSDSFGLNPA